MTIDEKIEKIIKFVRAHPQSTASRTIIREHILDNEDYETSKELSIVLNRHLLKDSEEEIDFYYYLIK